MSLTTWYALTVSQRRTLLAIYKVSNQLDVFEKKRVQRVKRINIRSVTALKTAGLVENKDKLTRKGVALVKSLPANVINPTARPSELRATFGVLAEKLGGLEPLAEEIGVSIRTIQRYSTRTVTIPVPALKMLQKLAEQNGIKNPTF